MGRLLVALFAVLSVCGSHEVAAAGDARVSLSDPVELSGTWKTAPGDDPAFADPELDDASWRDVEVPHERSRARLDSREIAWFRREIAFDPPARDGAPVGLLIGVVFASYEVFADGRLIGASGRVGLPGSVAPREVRVFALPPELLADSRLVIALRVWSPDWGGRAASNRILDLGKPTIGSVGSLRLLARAMRMDFGLKTQAPIGAVTLLVLLVGLFHLYLFRQRRELKAYLYHGIALVLVACAYLPRFLWWNDWPGALSAGSQLELAHRVYNGLGWFAWGYFYQSAYVLLHGRAPGRIGRILQGWLAIGLALQLLLWNTDWPLVHDTLLTATMMGPAIAVTGWMIVSEALRHGNSNARNLALLGIASVAVWCVDELDVTFHVLTPAPLYLEPFVPLPFILGMALVLARHFAHTLDDLDETHRAARRFVPFAFLELLHKGTITEIRKGDQVATDISILFSDVRGFTSLAERIGPQATFDFINRYLTHMEPAVNREEGFINDIFGDAIMVLFHQGSDAAVRAALAMLEALPRFNDEIAAYGMGPVEIGIGINSGRLMLGTIGGEQRLSCTVVGDPANLASRTEALTKFYGATLLVTGHVRERLADPTLYSMRELDRVRVLGKSEPVSLWEVLDGAAPVHRAAKLATRKIFAEALACYRQAAFAAARERFARCEAEAPGDRAALLYVERCDEFLRHPPAQWDAVTALETK